jgi:hypothetical protein
MSTKFDTHPMTDPRNPEVVALAARLLRTPEEVAEKMREIDVLETGGDLKTVKPETIGMWLQIREKSPEQIEREAAATVFPWEVAPGATS